MLTGVRVLIVEDEPLVALDLQTTFADAGATATCARSIEHALDILHLDLVDFCVLDTQLWQGETSHDLTHVLKFKGIPFAVFSAYRTPIDGAIAHVSKPFTSAEVVAVAERYLELRGK